MGEETRDFEKEEYHELINGMNDAVFIHDLEGNFLAVNDEAVNRLGYSREELLDLRPQDIDAPEYSEKVKDRIQDIEEGETLVFETVHVTKSGEEIPVEINSSLITYQGEPAVLSVARDITKRKGAEERFKKLFSASPDAIYFIDKNGVLQNFNKALVELVGYEREEMMGKRLSEFPFFPPETKEKVTENFKKRLQGEEVSPYMIEGETKNGERLFAEVNANLIEEEGEPVGEIGIARNITERKKAEEKYRDLFESTRVAIVVHDPDGRIVSANPAAEEAFGLKEEELKEKSLDYWKGLLYKENGKQMKISEFPVSKVLDSKQPVEEQIMGLSTEETREIKWYIVTAVPQFNEKGEIERIINSFKDITARKKAEERKDFLNTLLRQDLRSKYQTIQGYHQLLEEEADLPEEHGKYLKKSMKAGGEADEILDLAKELEGIEESEWVTEKDIVKVLENVIDNISGLVEREEVEIEENYPEKISKVKGDYSLNTLFTQLLMTRIQNSKCDNIRINASEREEDILLKIEDNGKQLPEDIKNIFTGEVYTGETTGAGGVRYYMLGEIARHNKAEIEVQDSKLGGAKFDVRLKKAQ